MLSERFCILSKGGREREVVQCSVIAPRHTRRSGSVVHTPAQKSFWNWFYFYFSLKFFLTSLTCVWNRRPAEFAGSRLVQQVSSSNMRAIGFLMTLWKKRKRPVHILSHSRFTKCPLSFQPPASSSKWEEEEEELIALAYIWNPPICSVPFFFSFGEGGPLTFFPTDKSPKRREKTIWPHSTCTHVGPSFFFCFGVH